MLYAIGDLHLSLDGSKSMEVFGPRWKDYSRRLTEAFAGLGEEDVCVLCGDTAWGLTLPECLEEFRLIDSFPGRKLILKGNHDYWWTTAAKIQRFFRDNGITTIRLLHNNSFRLGALAVCGTKGWFYEENTGTPHDKKIMNREIMRLEASLRSAGDAERKLCFLHYPPIFGAYRCREILDLFEKYGVTDCCYGHLHGPEAARGAPRGLIGGVNYRLVACDQVGFSPVPVAEWEEAGG